jgi:triacylglycerol lipase
MGISTYVGRVGGLAVALGLGAATVTGHGALAMAWAEPTADTDGTASDSSPTARDQPMEPAASTSAETSTSAVTGRPVPDGQEPRTSQRRTRERPTSHREATGESSTPSTSVDQEDTAPLHESSNPERDSASDVSSTAAVPSHPKIVVSVPLTPTPTNAQAERGGDPSPTAAWTQLRSEISTSGTDADPQAVVVKQADPTDTDHIGKYESASPPRARFAVDAAWAGAAANNEPPTRQSEVAKTVAAEPIPAVMTALTSLFSAVLNPFKANDTTPTTPASMPAVWALLAFARREIGQSGLELPAAREPALPSVDGQVLATAVSPEPSIKDESDALAAPMSDAQSVANVSVAQANYADAFSGTPSIVAAVVAFALQIVDRVVDTFGLQDLLAAATKLIEAPQPPWFLTLGLDAERTEFDGMPVWTFKAPNSTSEKVVVAIHGGGYVYDITYFGWANYTQWARDTGATVVVPLYPALPEGSAAEIVPKMADLIAAQVAQHGPDNVSVEGDSAGASIGLAAVQLLVQRGSPVPGRMVLISPALDYVLTDPRSAAINDPLIDIPTLQAAGELWGRGLPGGVANPWVSPLYGSLEGLPQMWIYSGSLDALSPAVLDLQKRAIAEDAPFTFILRKGELHGWAAYFFLFPEAFALLPAIEGQLVGDFDDSV